MIAAPRALMRSAAIRVMGTRTAIHGLTFRKSRFDRGLPRPAQTGYVGYTTFSSICVN